MIVRRISNTSKVVTITCTVASVLGHRPLVGFCKQVEEAWEKLKKRHAIKRRNTTKMKKTTSLNELTENRENDSDVGKVMLKFRQLEKDEIEGKKDDVYSKDYVPKKYSKMAGEYGTPKPGTLTEMRAKKATKHIAREMLQICEVIMENGYRSRDGHVKITFGKLFQIYQYISDKVVGILLRARKHNMVAFEGEMLYQRRDEDVIITCLLTEEDIKKGYEQIG